MPAKEWRRFDWILMAAFLALCVIGTVEIYFSTQVGGVSPYLSRQLVRLVIGIALFLLVLIIDYRAIVSNVIVLYVLSLGVLVFVLFFGVEIHANRSWLQFGGVSVQPSEFVKIVVILALAKFFADFTDRYLKPGPLLVGGLIVLAPTVLIVMQHDLGTALTLPPVFFGMVLLAGVRPKILVVSVLVLLLALGGSWFVLRDYQRARIKVVLNPQLDPQGTGYQTLQSVIAVGSGGFFGRGLGEGSQGALGFLPERHTDFIFSVIGEETGFVGALLVLLLYMTIFYRALKIAFDTLDKTAMYACVGIVILYGVHLAINIGMTLGLMPVIGIPLPPLSYGGSSLLSAFIAMALLNNFQIHRYLV